MSLLGSPGQSRRIALGERRVGGTGRVPWEVLPLGRRILLWQHRTQPGTLERDCGDLGLMIEIEISQACH